MLLPESDPSNTSQSSLTPVPSFLFDIQKILKQQSSLKSAADEIFSILGGHIPFDYVLIYLPDSHSGKLDLMYAHDIKASEMIEEDFAWSESLAQNIFVNPQPVIDQTPQNAPNASSVLYGMPLLSNQETLGVMMLIQFAPIPYSPSDLQLVEWIAGELAHQALIDRLKQQNLALQQVSPDDLLSMLAHELRTPLGFIKGYTTTLLRADTSWDPQNQKEFLSIIEQETLRIEKLIENLLDSSRIKNGLLSLDLQPVRLDALMNDCIARAKIRNSGLKVYFNVEKPLKPIPGDPTRLTQVLENLLNNSEKYASGSPVWITIKQEGNTILISVEDHGPGIPARYQSLVFDQFFRNPELAPSVHGSGLGLFICKKIIDAHHGKIWVESQEQQKTTFFISLPA